MLSVAVIDAGAAGAGYAAYQENEQEKNREDYWSGEQDKGRWLGREAQEMGLVGEIQKGQLLAGLQGFHPATGEALARNAGEQHKCGWDLTFSAPKSVSCVWSVADPETRAAIEVAQNAAAAHGLAFLEDSGAFISRSRTEPGPVQGVIAAGYLHGTSREADPQLHTHVAVLNMQRDGTAIDFDTRWKMAAGAAYRAELASRLRELGFQVESDGKSFRIVGVPATVEKEFSTRREQIEAQLKEKGYTSAKAAEVATLGTRKAKEPTTRAELFQDWQERAQAHGFDQQAVHAMREMTRPEAAQELNQAEILRSLTEQASTFTPQQLAAGVAVAMQGKGNAEAIQNFIHDLHGNPELVRLESQKPRHLVRGEPTEIRYTTREMMEVERGILDKAQARATENKHHADTAAAIAARPTMTEEQKSALHHVCEKPGAVQVIEGMAGTGKSYLMAAARESWQAQGFEVIGAALAAKAASGLRAGAGIQSQTIHSLLHELDQGQRQLSSKSILVVDESGMVGSRQMARLLDHIHQAGAKAVLIGDSRQLQPVDAGGAFRLLSQSVGHASLQNIIRQKNEADRILVKQFANGQAAEALTAMNERGLLKTAGTRAEGMREMVRDWAQARDPSRPGESLMVAATRSEVQQINTLARQMLKAEGRLSGGIAVHTATGVREFAVGDRIIFTQNSKRVGVDNADFARIQSVRFNKSGQLEIRAQMDDGRSVAFEVGEGKSQYQNFDHGYAMTVHKAQGVTVDRTFVMPSDSMSGREWAYVANSRSRLETKLYIIRDQLEELTKTMSRSQAKETSLDFKLAEKNGLSESLTRRENDLADINTSPATEKAPVAVFGEEWRRHLSDQHQKVHEPAIQPIPGQATPEAAPEAAAEPAPAAEAGMAPD